MRGDTEATLKATKKAISQGISQATAKVLYNKTQATANKGKSLSHNVTVITFGSLTFTIQNDELQDKYNSSILPTSVMPATHIPTVQATPTAQILTVQTPTMQATPTVQIPIEQATTEMNEAPTKKHHTIKQRFVRPTPATAEWQTVVSKNKWGRKQNRRCFNCHKTGHIQRFCWKKRKCHNCGRIGHISTHCPSNPNRLHTKPVHTYPAANTQPITLSPEKIFMEDLQNRPHLGEVYCPPRFDLDYDNEYLARVGLLILITGSPSLDLPALIASKLASIYGGHQNNYRISQAATTPYIVTCTDTRVRDAIVQGGTYYIPHRQIRFTVHEWRPRFGLGYDPPTHQAWVRIVGLPLQAWTTREISTFLQKFGHPTHILPYGQEAGHYKYITALVDTGHPSRISLAYKYREGHYSTLVDIVILSWRDWLPGYFPPPDDQPGQRGNQQPPPPASIHTMTTMHPKIKALLLPPPI